MPLLRDDAPAPGPDGPDPAASLAAARAGDPAAFARLHRAFLPVVHGIALAHVGPDDADDVTQEAFLAMHRRLDDLRDPAALPGWVVAVARNAARDRLRRRARDPAPRAGDAGLEAVAARAPADRGDGGAALRARVLAALASVPEAYREALVWRLVEGLTGPEIAARTGRSPGAVRVHLCTGLARLRAALGKEPL